MKKYERTLRLSFNFLRDYLCLPELQRQAGGKKNQYAKKSVQISLISVLCVPLFVMNTPPRWGGVFHRHSPPLTATRQKIQIWPECSAGHAVRTEGVGHEHIG